MPFWLPKGFIGTLCSRTAGETCITKIKAPPEVSGIDRQRFAKEWLCSFPPPVARTPLKEVQRVKNRKS